MALEFLGARYGGGCSVADGRTRERVVSINRKISQSEEDAQNWEVIVELISELRGLRSKVKAHELTHGITPFTLPMPQDLKSIGPDYPTGNLAVAVNKDGGAASVTCTAASPVKLSVGHYIGFSNHRKVYMVTDDVSIGAARRVVPIYPDLLDDVTTSETVALEPDLYAVHNFAALGFGVRKMDGRTEHYALMSLTEYLE